MINMFRTVLLNMDPVTANANPLLPGYMIVDSAYTVKELNSLNKNIYEALFVGATTDAARIARATTIHNLIKGGMLAELLIKYDVRISGVSSKSEESPDVIKNILDALDKVPADPSTSIFTGTGDKELYGEHAFFRDEPVENIAGFTVAMVEDIIKTRRLEAQ